MGDNRDSPFVTSLNIRDLGARAKNLRLTGQVIIVSQLGKAEVYQIAFG